MNTIFAIAGGLWALWTAWEIYRNNWWKPKVSVNSVDYANGTAELTVNGDPVTLFEGSTMAAGADWGVRFGGSDADKSTRVELVNGDLVHAVLHAQPATLPVAVPAAA